MALPLSIANKRRRRVLAVVDDYGMTTWLKSVMEVEGYEVRVAPNGAQGEEIFRYWRPDVVLTDLTLPDIDGIDLLRRLKDIDSQPETIVIGGQGTITRAVEAGRAGAFFFLEKPVTEDGLMDLLRKAARRTEERVEHQHLKEQVREQYSFANVVGQSRVMKELFDLIESVAASDANILIQGENGTGKEVIANAIHHHSNRASGPFIKINCASIPKDLIESELFGYKKGAFTGAFSDKIGLLEMAEGGSLLLDEIGEMPPYLQTKLLRVLQEREYRPIGSDRLVTVDFRLICATNIDIEVALREGKLREDLYFRINTIALRVAPLRERTEDVPLLCNHFLSKFNRRYQKSVRSVSPSAYHLLIRNRWAGNVRELENAIERAVLVCKTGEVTPSDLPESIREENITVQEFSIPPHRTLAEIERMAIVQTLQRTNWNKQEAAQILGLYRPTLYSKMKKHDIKDQRGQRRPASPAR
ncbi:MAG TPA: sigma-54 dependent transcriptional regulator [Vicinamibacterales bacterium]|nr:sigma-54 dependent transcriptional regulator [Vicinamibacterales bacterium]